MSENLNKKMIKNERANKIYLIRRDDDVAVPRPICPHSAGKGGRRVRLGRRPKTLLAPVETAAKLRLKLCLTPRPHRLQETRALASKDFVDVPVGLVLKVNGDAQTAQRLRETKVLGQCVFAS